VASGSKDPPESYTSHRVLGPQDPRGVYTPHKVLWHQDRRIHLDPTPLTGFCGLRIVGSAWSLHPSQGSVAPGSQDPPGSDTSGSQDPPGSDTSHRVLWPQDRRIPVNPTPLTGFGSVASGSKDPPGSYTPHKVLWPQDRKIHLDPTPLTGFWGLRIVGSTWILHPSQGSGASGSKDPPVSYTSHMVLWPRDRRIHLDPTPLTRFWGLKIGRSTWILHPSQGSVASGSKDPPGSYTPHRGLWPQGRRIRVDPIPLTGFCGVRIEGSTWILHPSQGSVASGS
jgi:hypothetical protein